MKEKIVTRYKKSCNIFFVVWVNTPKYEEGSLLFFQLGTFAIIFLSLSSFLLGYKAVLGLFELSKSKFSDINFRRGDCVELQMVLMAEFG